MSPLPRFSIDLSEKFPKLAHAPSIEAAIHWQAPAGTPLKPELLREELAKRLPEYPIFQPQQDVEIVATGLPDGSIESFQRNQWCGFRLQDAQNRHVAQFTTTGVVFSRLQPYEEWTSFEAEALRFWNIFLELAEPITLDRLGVRYINRIPLSDGEQPATYLKTVPSAPAGIELPSESFFHQDTYRIPGYPYTVNWVRTIQLQGTEPSDGRALIVDIDVFTNNLLELNEENLRRRLGDMRWLKNKIFFSCITDTALKRFGA
jgi:uncharacterized protein (TIGR04255 family)